MLRRMSPKQRAAERALELICDNMVVGLGTGSTADFFLQALGAAIGSGQLRGVRGVPTSKRSETRAHELGIPLSTLIETPHPDLTVDGADEVAPNCDAIKGLGGALLREKMVAQASKRIALIVDESKVVQTLGTHAPLPVEVTPFSHEVHVSFFRSLGASPELRREVDGKPFVTDNGNFIYHCRFERIVDPLRTELSLKSHAGVVETGLFLGIAAEAFIASSSEVRRIAR